MTRLIQSGTVQGNKGWIIQDNEVRLNYAVGIKVEPGENSKIIGNYVHDNGQLGLGGSGNDILVEGNEIAKNGFWSGIDVLWEGGGFKFANTNGLIVRGNYSHDNHGPGMWTDINNIHTLYENNLVVHNTHIGITHEISYDAVIRNNTLIGNGYGDPRGWLWGAEIQIQNSKNVDVYGNRIDMTGGGNGVVLIQQNRGSGTYGPYGTTGNHIHDNVIVDHDNTGNEGDNERTGNCDRCVGGVADYNWAGMANGGNTWSNNQYYMPDVGNRFWWGETYNFAGIQERHARNWLSLTGLSQYRRLVEVVVAKPVDGDFACAGACKENLGRVARVLDPHGVFASHHYPPNFDLRAGFDETQNRAAPAPISKSS